MSQTLFVCTLCLIGYPTLSAQSEIIDRIVALVNASAITESDVKDALARFDQEISSIKNPALRRKKREEFHKDVINKLINEKLFKAELEKAKIVISDEELTQSIDGMLKRKQATKQQLMNELSKQGITFDQYKAQISQKLQSDKFMQQVIYPRIHISDYDLEKYYNEHLDEFVGYNQIRFLEIFLTDESVPAGMKPAALPPKIISDLNKGVPFKTLVKKYSRGAFAQTGGNSGLLNTSQMRPELLSILLNLKLNVVSNPIPINNGVFILKVVERKGKKTRPFNQVKQQVHQKNIQVRINEELERYLAEVRNRSYVEIR